jgi:hypothetical protein
MKTTRNVLINSVGPDSFPEQWSLNFDFAFKTDRNTCNLRTNVIEILIKYVFCEIDK